MATKVLSGSLRSSEPDSFSLPPGAASVAGAVYQPAGPQPGQPLLLFPQQGRALGAPCEVARLLRARCEALGVQQAAQQRIDEFSALILKINDVRDEEKASVIHLLLAKIPLLPDAARADALRDAATLAGGAGVDELPGLCAQLARTVRTLPPEERPAALRNALLRVGSLPPDSRGMPLPALAAALSSLHDAGAQLAMLDMVCSLTDKSAASQRPAALEQLAAVSWLTDAVRLSAHAATLQRLLQMDDAAACATTLARLAADLPKLPRASRPDAFDDLLQVCAGMPPEERPALLTLLDDAIGSLPETLHFAARNAITDAGGASITRRAPAGAALHGGDAPAGRTTTWTYAAFTTALAAACKRSPANRKAVLEELSVELGSLPGHQRAPALYAWLAAVNHPSPAVRAALLCRVTHEIRTLPDHLRLSAWTKLQAAAEQLPEADCSRLLTALSPRIGDLPASARLPAHKLLLSAASRLLSAGEPLLQAVAGTMAMLPEQERAGMFEQMYAMASDEPAMTRALADQLGQLPAERRHAAFRRLFAHCKDDADPLFAALARALPALPEPACMSAFFQLLHATRTLTSLVAVTQGLERCSTTLSAIVLYSYLAAALKCPWTTSSGQTANDAWRSLMQAARPLLLRQPGAHWAQLEMTDTNWHKEADNYGAIPRLAKICRIASSTASLQSKSQSIHALPKWEEYYRNVLLVLPDDLMLQVSLDAPVATVEDLDRLLASNLPDTEKAARLAGLLANPPKAKEHGLQVAVEHWLGMLVRIVPWAANSSLPAQQASALLMAQGTPADEKSLYRSNALLTALHNSNTSFVELYAMHIAGAALPDEVKAALLSGRNTAGNNEQEMKTCMKAADVATREAYKRQVSMSALAEPVRKELVRYC